MRHRRGMPCAWLCLAVVLLAATTDATTKVHRVLAPCSTSNSVSTATALNTQLSSALSGSCATATISITSAGTYRLASEYTLSSAINIILTAASAPGTVTLLPSGRGSRHFSVTAGSANLTLISLRLSDAFLYGTGSSTLYGASVYLTAGSGYFQGVTFTNNTLYGVGSGVLLGGAIYAGNDAALTFKGCSLTGNRAESTGGRVAGGALSYYYTGSARALVMESTRFVANSAISVANSEGGGFVASAPTSASFSMKNCSVLRNKAWSTASSGSVFITGGGALIQGFNLQARSSNFSGNRILATGTSSSAALYALGGGLYLKALTATFTDATVANNSLTVAGTVSSSSQGRGGAAYVEAPSTVTFTGSSLLTRNAANSANNVAGGALYVEAASTLQLYGATVVTSTATSPSSAAYNTITKVAGSGTITQPTQAPTSPTVSPTLAPTAPTQAPTQAPSQAPTLLTPLNRGGRAGKKAGGSPVAVAVGVVVALVVVLVGVVTLARRKCAPTGHIRPGGSAASQPV